MLLRSLLESLQAFPNSKNKVIWLFQQLSISDLGYYTFDEPPAHFRLDQFLNIEAPFSLADKIEAELFSKNIYASTLFQNHNVSLCWFLLPPGTLLALHDHPSMEVYQRVLFGEVEICEVNVDNPSVSREGSHGTFSRKAMRANHNSSLSSCVLAPKKQLFHEVRNNSSKPALFIDLISPPYYTPPLNIACTYFTASCVQWTSDSFQNNNSGIHGDFRDGDRVIIRPRLNYFPRMKGLQLVRTW